MRTRRLLTFVLAAMAFAVPVAAQTPVTAADLTRLEAGASEVSKAVTALERTDATLSAEMKKQLGDVTDEITYLKVKMRREGTVTREEYASVRDRLDTLRIRAQGQKVSSSPAGADPSGRMITVPVGTEFDVRLQTPLNSGTAKIETRFEATTLLDYQVEGMMAIPAGALVRGFVSSVQKAGRLDRRGSMTLSFDELRIDERTYRLRASVVQALDGKVGEDATRIGAGAAVGAIIGGILGGGKGALLGVLVGGGGTIASTEGSDVDLPAGTILRIRIDQPLQIARD